MPLVPLLDKTTAPLNRLALQRVLLDVAAPRVRFMTQGEELALFALVGRTRIAVNGKRLVAEFGGRRRVTEQQIHVVRCPAGISMDVEIELMGHAADLLMASCRVQEPLARSFAEPPGISIHLSDTIFHDVGEGCYRRIVGEVPTPEGYELRIGQTFSDGVNGCWSSWPSHAAPEEVSRYAEHEEVFFCCTSGHFLMEEDGIYCTGEKVQGLRRIENGQALVTPLGSHCLTTSPGDVGTYCWFYVSFLKKQYNKYSTDSIRAVYVK